MNLFSFAWSHEDFFLVYLRCEQTLIGYKQGTSRGRQLHFRPVKISEDFFLRFSATHVVILAIIFSDWDPFITVAASLWKCLMLLT